MGGFPAGWPDDTTATFDPVKTRALGPVLPPAGAGGAREPLPAWSISLPGSGEDGADRSRPAFRLERLAGVGGFGEVWQAVQLSLGRRVALKRLRGPSEPGPGRGPSSARTRSELFRQEAEITALLEHPSIVPVYDLGEDEGGEPVLAMRFVRGSHWKDLLERDFAELEADEYLARHLPVLKGVAQALAFAHARGVVHRDVKPGQVMVGDFGEVLLLDWGLAVHVGEPAGAQGAAGRAVATRATATNPAGTLAYMAPEQTDEDASRIGPWTDVYLLGGTLYTLLTGALPHPAPETTVAFRQAEAGTVVPLAEASPGRAIPPELADLAMRCLAPRADDRPGSVREVVDLLDDFLGGAGRRRQSIALSNDALARLERGVGDYRAHADVLAQLARARELWPGNHDAEALADDVSESFARSALEGSDLGLSRVQAERVSEPDRREALLAEIDARVREQRWIARQRTMALAAAALLLAVVAASSTFYAVAIARARDRAEAARRGEALARGRSEDLLQFMLHDLKEELENAGRLPVLEKVALKALDELRRLPPGQLSEAALAQRAGALDMLGGVLTRHGNVAAAANAYLESRSIREGLARRSPADPERTHALAISEGHLAEMARASGDVKGALDAARRSLALHQAAHAAPGAAPERTLDLASAKMRLGELLADGGDQVAALREHRAAVALLEEGQRAHPSNPAFLRDLAVARSKVGDVLAEQGQLAAALAEYRAYKVALASLAARDPSNADFQRELAVGHNSVGWALRALGDLDGALVEFQAQREIGLRLVARDGANTLFRRDVAQATAVIGRVLLARGAGEAALAELKSAAAELAALAQADPENRDAARDAAVAAALVGEVLVTRKEKAAAAALRPAVASLTTLAAQDPGNAGWTLDLAVAELWLARALLLAGDAAGARGVLDASAGRLRPLTKNLPAADARAIATRAFALLLLGRREEARPLAARALSTGAADPALAALAREAGISPEAPGR